MKEHTPVHARSSFAHGIHDANYPLIVLSAIDPCRHVTAGFHFRNQRLKTFTGTGQMMKDADRKRAVEHSLQRQMINVGLNDMSVREVSGRGKGDFNGIAQIDGDDVLNAPAGNATRVTTFTASTFKHDFSHEELSIDRGNPIQ